MSRSVPDRWREYKTCMLNPIKNERIISFKTPLSKKFDYNGQPDDGGITENERFTPTDLVDSLAAKDLYIGLVLDFTYTKRYYNPKEFTDKGIEYLKMMCPGHEIPKEEDVQRFELEVHSFLKEEKTGKLVGVHCTHGVNRTGYMVCRYLIDCKEYKPDEAIAAFNEARGHPIERENYLEDLKSRVPGNGSHLYDLKIEKRHRNKQSEEFPPKRHRNPNEHRPERGHPPYEREFYHHDRNEYNDPYYRHQGNRSNLRFHPYNTRHRGEQYYDNDNICYHYQHSYQDRPERSPNYNCHYDSHSYNKYDGDHFQNQGRYGGRRFHDRNDDRYDTHNWRRDGRDGRDRYRWTSGKSGRK